MYKDREGAGKQGCGECGHGVQVMADAQDRGE